MTSIQLDDGTGLDLKYLVTDTDRHGNERIYVRRHGRKVRIREMATVEDFMAAYRAALETPSVDRRSTTAAPGSLRWLVQSYYGSAEFTGLHESTRTKRRLILEGICVDHGTKPFARLETKHVRTLIRDPKAATPEAANGRVKALRQVFKWAVEVGAAHDNPARDVPMLSPNNPDGFHTWTREEVQQYQATIQAGPRPGWRWRCSCARGFGFQTRCGSGLRWSATGCCASLRKRTARTSPSIAKSRSCRRSGPNWTPTRPATWLIS